MTTTLDLNLLPIARYGGRDFPEMVGLHFSEPPRRAARGRNLDRLILYLVLDGNALLAPEQRDQVLADLSRLYYRTSGSVTAALKTTAEDLNQMLLERNRLSGTNRQCLGRLTQVVIREGRLYLAQSGLAHVFLVTDDGVHHILDSDLSGPGLGLSRTASVGFAQASLNANDTLLLAALPSPDWRDEVLTSIRNQGPESLRRRLFYHTNADINAVAVQAKQGKGKILLLPAPTRHPSEPRLEPPPAPLAEKQPPVIMLPESVGEPQISEQAPVEETEPQAFSMVDTQDSGAPAVPAFQQGTDQAAEENAESSLPSSSPLKMETLDSPAAASKAGFTASIKKSLQGLLAGIRTFLGRMLPDEPFINIPSSVMALVAVAVPVVIVTAASMVYFRLGKAAQFELFSSQARQVALQAMEQTDLGARRADLGTALSLLQKAEEFAATDEAGAEIQNLREQVRNALDELDFVRRLNYQPAIVGGLPITSNIVGMAAIDEDLYMLDETSGEVLRAYLTDRGYEIDYTFQCKPGKYSEIAVGPLIEVIAWPAGYKPEAKVIAADSNGNVLYCQPDEAPKAEWLTPAPEENWGNILEATLDQGDFFTLDLQSNEVWIYWRSNFGEQPAKFFDEEAPPMQDVRDMLVDRDDLYLLQLDGSMMLCVRDTLVVSPTRCQMQSYIDRRPGREGLPLVPPTSFIQIISTPPPDPSLYLLEPGSHAAYHFSLRNLSFQKQYLPEIPLPSRDATAFAINNSLRYLYLALGNQIFYAAKP